MTGDQFNAIREGDEVTVRGVVADSMEGNLIVRVGICHLSIRAEQVASHTPKALSVGDRVINRYTLDRGELVAIHNERAWVMCNFGYLTFSLSDLEGRYRPER